MPLYKYFEDMPIWSQAKRVAMAVYKITDGGKAARDFTLKDQMRRSAISMSSNIAEGFECGSSKGFVRYLYIAKASAAELRSQIEIAAELGYFPELEKKKLKDDLESFAKQTSAFIQNLKNRDGRRRESEATTRIHH